MKNISAKTGLNFVEIFKQLTFERFLARVAASEHREKLIFKGGLCLKQYIEIGRETRDIDFLVRSVDANIGDMESIFTEIAQITFDDLFDFSDVVVNKLEIDHKQYPGFRIKMKVKLGSMKDSLQIDLGIGDVVEPEEMKLGQIMYKDAPLLDQGDIGLLVYPPEYIFSEKLHSIVLLKGASSRMKDYYDCYRLIKEGILDSEKIKDAISKTFEQRQTELEKIEFYGEEVAARWTAFRKKVGEVPESIQDVIEEIDTYLEKVSAYS